MKWVGFENGEIGEENLGSLVFARLEVNSKRKGQYINNPGSMSTGGSTPISSSAGSVNTGANVGDGGSHEDCQIYDKTPLWAFVKKIRKSASGGDIGKKRKTVAGSSSIEKAFQNSAREECDAEIARMFYTGGLPFNLARNPHYRNSYIRASTLPGYVPPGYNAIRTTLLAKEKKNIEKHLQPLKLSWKDKGVSICSDGWSDAQRRPLINVIAISESGPMMLRAVNCEGEYKDSELIANLIIESIKEVGYENVVQVITDNAPVCAKAGAAIASKYPTIFWTPCVVHTLNLALKNICTPSNCLSNIDVYDPCSWIQPIAEHVMYIKNFIMNHGMRLVMFNDHCPLKLLSVAPTRFASTIIMFKRFKAIKNGFATNGD
ncbi:uncharacterized protein LOC126793822 [Argentina anserina]|uniref:uncharacterized protein LOC126793822 n=1 Tax=Argentina anserina TaxID=57926 RepID=UPI0021761ED8|nr:uncharacterized protein LOC126793822 [Potentilla anserina]